MQNNLDGLLQPTINAEIVYNSTHVGNERSEGNLTIRSRTRPRDSVDELPNPDAAGGSGWCPPWVCHDRKPVVDLDDRPGVHVLPSEDAQPRRAPRAPIISQHDLLKKTDPDHTDGSDERPSWEPPIYE